MNRKQLIIRQLVDRVDYPLLYQQKQDLVRAMETGCPVPAETLEGLVNYLDAVGDMAEAIGLFTYPKEVTGNV